MLRSFIGWLDDRLADSGPVGLMGAILGVLALGATLSAVFGTTTIKAAAVVAALIGVLGLFLLLFAERSDHHRRDAENRRLLARYCDALLERSALYYRILRWTQATIIEPNGDTTSRICIHARSEIDDLLFFRMRFGAGWSQPAPLRKKVDVQVRSVVVNGIGGTRCDVSMYWRTDERLETLVHFTSKLARNSEFQVMLDVTWPGKCRPLMRDRSPDDFVTRPSRGMEHLQYVVVLPPGEEAYCDPIGFDATDPRFTITTHLTDDGRMKIALTSTNVPPTPKIGLRLDLKPKKHAERYRVNSGHQATDAYLSALVSSPPPERRANETT